MNVEALNQLKRVLQESIDGKLTTEFNMAVYCKTLNIGFNCKTHACAAGSAALDPWFISKGFVADVSKNLVRYGDLVEFKACMNFFDLTSEQTDTLFMPCYYPDFNIKEQQVIDRIDFMLAEMDNVTA